MKSLIDDLKVLLDNPPYIKDIFEFWAQETDDWWAGEKPAKEAMTRWVKDVEAVLEVAGRRNEVKIWRDATQTISTEFEDEERKKVLLKRIISELEKGHERTIQLVDRLGELLRNFEDLRDGSLFLQSEGVEWYEADKHYIDELVSWADTVETILRSDDRDEELKSWQEIRKTDIVLINVYNCADRLRILLGQIKSRLEQEIDSGYAPDLAQVTQTPFLSPSDISSAYKMSELYIILHCYENSVRRLIERVFTDEYGVDWWNKIASENMKKIVRSRKETEKKKRWLSTRGETSSLYYLEWGDLVKLIRKEKDLFLSQIGSLRFVENRFEELESLRNIVAHNGILSSDHDFQRVIISFRDWCRQVGS